MIGGSFALLQMMVMVGPQALPMAVFASVTGAAFLGGVS